MEEWNGIWKKNFSMEWNGKFQYGMEEILQYGIWKNRLPFHSIACSGCQACTMPRLYIPPFFS